MPFLSDCDDESVPQPGPFAEMASISTQVSFGDALLKLSTARCLTEPHILRPGPALQPAHTRLQPPGQPNLSAVLQLTQLTICLQLKLALPCTPVVQQAQAPQLATPVCAVLLPQNSQPHKTAQARALHACAEAMHCYFQADIATQAAPKHRSAGPVPPEETAWQPPQALHLKLSG